ncbi:polysaccharide biosynthesis tyrosine autokinase [Ichthyenterobacterium sp. W332]|uniref:non-specific protein-tyrosine kinase n=1 Tax=Microcosmobacter mediterraneus TaxID=3075607 RepID=A0ABU2YKP8_9FLAO|nr:polysaccharide biosynthesis tyrosine autokinase [Ichthyenterobacterium sp. W332]MDT0558721.1 polysaccharide biosynthesis tyrosine autokinase [Ichthyenterobacterium sp. W332]
MNSTSSRHNFNAINRLDAFTRRWKLILLSIIFFLGIAFLYLRYANYQYQATAVIKIKEEDKQNNSLKEITALQNFGPFSNTYNKVSDEIEIIKSRTIIGKVVDDLDLNIQYYEQGRIKEQELFKNPPILINFFASDSVVHKIDTSFYINIKSDSKFLLSNEGGKDILKLGSPDGKNYAFGDRIKSGFGDFIIIPNEIKDDKPLIGRSIKVKISSMSSAVETYLRKLKVQATDETSSVVKLTLNENIKNKANQILDKIVEKYNDDVINDKEQIVKITSDFINNRLNIVSNELEQVDYTAESLQKDNRLTALSAQSNIFLQSEKENEAKLIATSNQIQLIDYMKDHLKDNDTNADLLPADVGIADNSVSQITKSHNELVLQRNRILKNSSEKNPTVVNLNNQIRALKDNLNQSLENIQSANQITLNALNQEDRRISAQIYSAPTKERKFRDIKRQQDIKESLYLYLLQKREETAISLGMSSPNAKIIDASYATTRPISPKKGLVYLSALVLGLLLPMTLIFIKEEFDTKIHTKNDLNEILNIPFIGDIPKSSKKKRLVNKVDYSPKAEAFRIVRSNIDFMLKSVASKCKVVFVTSTTSQEGKSHTSINLASSISFSEKKTLIIETDIRVPRVNEYLSIKAKKGLTDYISDPSIKVEDIIIKVKDNDSLSIIPSGTIPPNPAELLMSDRVDELFKTVKKDYDYIIVDTAAVGLVTDTLLISDHADMVVYVVSADNIDKRQLHIAQTMHDEKRLPNMVTLLNSTKKKKGYGYGYGSTPQKKKWYQFG